MLKSRVNKSGVRHIRVLVLGSLGCGKTALVSRMMNAEFPSRHLATIGTELFIRQADYEREHVALHLWSFGGHERLHPIIQQNYGDADAAIIAYDQTSHTSFIEVSFWRNEMLRTCPSSVILIVGLKSDLVDDITVSASTAESQAAKWNAKHISASSKTGEKVDEVVEELLKSVID